MVGDKEIDVDNLGKKPSSNWLMLAATVVVGACGGGGSAVAPVAQDTPQAASVAKILKITQNASNGAVGTLVLPTGESVTYFASAQNAGDLAQAQFKSGLDEFRVYFNADGTVNRIVNVGTGGYTIIQDRNDVLGANYLSFDQANKFLGGIGVYQKAGIWHSATVVGDMGQITANFSDVAGQGAVALRAVNLQYTNEKALDAKVQAALNGKITTASLWRRFIEGAIPNAFAQTSFTAAERARLYSGAAFAVVGSVVAVGVAGTIAPVIGAGLVAIGVVQAGRSIFSLNQRNLDTATAGIDNVLNDSTLSSYTEKDSAGSARKSWLERFRARAQTLLENGLNSIRPTQNLELDSSTTLPLTLPIPVPLTDSTQANPTLPAAAMRGATLTGTAVDATGRTYAANGVVDSAGNISSTSRSPAGDILTVTGVVAASGAVTGTTSRTFVGAPGVAAGALTGGKSAAIGACATRQESGGPGTFSFAVNLGRSSGKFNVSYDMYSIPDGMKVLVAGVTVLDTGGLVSGSATKVLSFSGTDTAFVNLYAPNSGTAWNITVGCAQ